MEIKRILVPVDFSEQAENASKVAAMVAKQTGSAISLLHMIEMPSGNTDMGASTNASTPASVMYIKKVQEKFQEYKALPFFEGVDVKEEIRFHKAFDGIMEYTKELNADLIVMGSQGASGLQEFIVGSNTEKVVRSSNVPVLVIKNLVGDFEINNITYASDFSDETKDSFQRVVDFTNAFNAKLHLLYINTPNNFESTKDSSYRMQTFASNYNLGPHSFNIYNETNIEKGIIDYSREIGTDLIAIHTHGRSGLLNLFTNHVSEDLVNHAQKPVITFKI